MEHVALYRLYRPMNFDDIVEQEHAVAALRQSVILGKIGHAYLFCGTRGTGKTSIAKVFSRAINCQHPVNGNPCNECEICKGVIDGSLLDVIEMDAASNNSVDNIRRICDEVMFMPAKAKYKVYIIDEVHMLSTGAFNALLKTLEEPPAHAVFLLATTEPHRIPATILSRCQRYDFRRISNESIVKRLSYIAAKQNISIEPDALSAIATIGDGALRDSVSLLDQVSTTSGATTITRDDILRITGIVDEAFLHKFATALLEGRAADLLPLCRELAMDGRDLIRFTLDLAQYFRNLLVTRISPNPQTLIESTSAAIANMKALASRTDSTTLLFFISRLSDLTNELKWSPSPRTSFEIMMLRLAARGNKIAPPIVPPLKPVAEAPAPAVQPAAPATPAPAPVAAPVPAGPVAAVPETPKADAPAPKAEAPAPVSEPEPEKVTTEAISEGLKAGLPVSKEDSNEKTEVLFPSSANIPETDAPVPAIAKMPSKEAPIPAIAKMPEAKAEPEKKPETPAPATPSVMAPPPVLDDLSAPPPAPDMDFMAVEPPDIPMPSDDDVPEEIPQEPSAPDAAELAHTQPTSPNLHKAFSSEHVNEGQSTNLAKATRKPDVRVPEIPNNIVVPVGDDAQAPKASRTPVSNLQKVIHNNGGDAFAAARTEFLDYLKKDYTFEYMYMCDCKLTWQDQTVWCIMPDSFAQSIEDIRGNPIIMTHLLSICQKHEPSLIHVNVTTQQDYDRQGTSASEGGNGGSSSGQPDWVKAVEKVSEENGIPLTHVKDM
ncbi:MAG: DNA polymerase III subunit gamma/tau [Saccharofermentanaceae bacterium]|nr:DNA polymerase III subunit gamma/tau [Saccharofermentanaceae bacterium]